MKHTYILIFLFAISTQLFADFAWKHGIYEFNIEENTGLVSLKVSDSLAFSFQAQARIEGQTIQSSNYPNHAVRTVLVKNRFGQGNCYEVIHNGHELLPDMIQRIYCFDNQPYFLTDIELLSNHILSSNCLIPLISYLPFSASPLKNQKQLIVPFDNDKWVEYRMQNPTSDMSYEVGAFISLDQSTWIFGSVDHDTWKSGLQSEISDGIINLLAFRCGVASTITHDTLPHGTMEGESIYSARLFVGHFKDWREGMEQYGIANTLATPTLKWEKAMPLGWNSWGAIQKNLNYNKAIEVSNYMADTLKSKGFSNNNTLYIGLDSYWDNLSEEELKSFVTHCHSKGVKAGIYWAPFVDWHRHEDRLVEGSSTKYSDVYLYAHGKPQELDGAWAIDPTHPAVQKRIDYFIGRFKSAGFEYIKLDFLTHGSLESDNHYLTEITTGMQAYNWGMTYLLSALDGKFFITMAISPLFPHQYAHSRRIACDAFGKMEDTKYTLNALTYAWWLGKVYSYLDPDHLIVGEEGLSLGENRARLTSGAITGLFMLGDDFTISAPQTVKERIDKLLKTSSFLPLLKQGTAFRPFFSEEMHKDEKTSPIFYLPIEEGCYVAVFNYSSKKQKYSIPLGDDLTQQLDASENYTVYELWEEKTKHAKKSLTVTVPAYDAQLYYISKKNK